MWCDHKCQFGRSLAADISRNDGPQLRCPVAKRLQRSAHRLACRHRNVHQQATAPCRSRCLYDENVIQRPAGKLASQRKVQCPLHLSAQLLGLQLYPSTSVSLSMLGLLQGPLKFQIDRLGLNGPVASAFRHDNSLPWTHTVTRAPARHSCATAQECLMVVAAVGAGPADRIIGRRAGSTAARGLSQT